MGWKPSISGVRPAIGMQWDVSQTLCSSLLSETTGHIVLPQPPLPQPWTFSCPNNPLKQRPVFLMTPLPPSSHPPFCGGFADLPLGDLTRTVAVSDWPGLIHGSGDLLGSVTCNTIFLGG